MKGQGGKTSEKDVSKDEVIGEVERRVRQKQKTRKSEKERSIEG